MSAHQGENRKPEKEVNAGPASVPAGEVDIGAHTSTPTVLRIVLGARLRSYRENSGLTMEEAAAAIRATHSKISRLENGRTGAKQRDIADLLTLYGVTSEAERGHLLALAQQASGPDWWHPYSDILPRWLEPYVGLERAAAVIRSYEVQFVHGLLQTEPYARSVIRIANAHANLREIDRRVNLRMERQKVLTQPDPPTLWAVLDEAVLHRPPDGREVMRAQIEHLLKLADLPNVTVQVVPFNAGPHAAAGGPFTILRFREPNLPDVVYLEQLNSAKYIDHPLDVADYLTIMDQLGTRGATPGDTIKMLRNLLREL